MERWIRTGVRLHVEAHTHSLLTQHYEEEPTWSLIRATAGSDSMVGVRAHEADVEKAANVWRCLTLPVTTTAEADDGGKD